MIIHCVFNEPDGTYRFRPDLVERLVAAGARLSNGGAIVSGTAGAADSIGVGDVAGRLAPGRPADVLVVAGDPTREVTALWNVLAVYQAGRPVARGVR